jgi:hypothetical protein
MTAPTRPAASPACVASSRPASGEELTVGDRGGRGSLRIENGTGSDAVVALYDLDRARTVRRVYVRAGEVGHALSIRPASYKLKVAFGSGLTINTGRFCTVTGANEFDETVVFDERLVGNAIECVRERITLHTVPDGNASVHGIDAAFVFADP